MRFKSRLSVMVRAYYRPRTRVTDKPADWVLLDGEAQTFLNAYNAVAPASMMVFNHMDTPDLFELIHLWSMSVIASDTDDTVDLSIPDQYVKTFRSLDAAIAAGTILFKQEI